MCFLIKFNKASLSCLILILLILFLASSFTPQFVFAQNNPFQAPNLTSNLPTGLTLFECYQLALKQSEKIAIQGQVIREAEGRFLQSISGILPKVNFQYSNRRQDGSGQSNFTLSEVPEAKFVFSQPLFSGFKEFAAMKGSKFEKEQRHQEKIRAEELLFTDVSDAFYFVLSYQDDIEALTRIQQALKERLDDLQKRESLGRSRTSEVASAEARLSRIEADLEFVRSEEEVARQLLEFLTGQPIAGLDDTQTDMVVTNQEDFEERIVQRADVLAAKNAWEVAKKQIAVAKADFWPTATLDGNYYTKRIGNSSGVDWDVTLNVDIPIFEGSETFGRVKETRAQSEQARLLFEETKRTANLEIQNAFTRLERSQRRLIALEKALSAAKKNYDLQRQDFQNNLVNNLDVLQSLEDLESAERDFVAVKNQTKQYYWNYKVALGETIHDTR